MESICRLKKFHLARMLRFSKLRFILPWIHPFVKVYLFMQALLLKCYRTKWHIKWIVYWTVDMKSSEAMIFTEGMNAILTIASRSLKNSWLQRGLHLWPRNSGATLLLTYSAISPQVVGTDLLWVQLASFGSSNQLSYDRKQQMVETGDLNPQIKKSKLSPLFSQILFFCSSTRP